MPKKNRTKKQPFKGLKRSSKKTNKNLEKSIKKSILLHQQGNLMQAFLLSEKALTDHPDNQTLSTNTAGFALSLGNALKEQEQFKEAENYYQKALHIKPDYADAYNNLGGLFKTQKKLKQAEEYYQKALHINPDYIEAIYALGGLSKEQKRLKQAETYYQEALSINPDYIEATYALSGLFKQQKQFKQAEEYYQKALNIDPDQVNATWKFSSLLLVLSRFSEGWKNYEYRYHPDNEDRESMGTIPPNNTTAPYQGENLSGKHILICPEQGIGDMVMFASILYELENKGARITLSCDARMVGLFNRSFSFITAIAEDKENRYQSLDKDLDYYLMIGSLPKFYRNDIKDFASHKPYFKTDEDLSKKWIERFKQLKHTINIGISWQGGVKAANRKSRSLRLEQLLPILSVANKGANIINLQYGDHKEEINSFTQQTNIIIHDWEDADSLKDLDNFAAQIKALDLVISIDNSTVHFSGALGVKTFVMLSFNQDWRWAEDRNDSYWYPNITRLFRQSTDGDWDEVIADISQILSN